MLSVVEDLPELIRDQRNSRGQTTANPEGGAGVNQPSIKEDVQTVVKVDMFIVVGMGSR